jgi:type I restriction enzyme S subunit
MRIPPGVPVLRIPNVILGKVSTDDLKYLAASKRVVESLRLEVGDLLFVRTNGRREYAGRSAVYQGEPGVALFASYLIRARLTASVVIPEFAQFYMMTAAGTAFLSGRASNAADGKFNINTQTIKGVLMPLPALEEQQIIVRALGASEARIVALEREIALHEELYRALLEELMTGLLSAVPLIEGAT